MVRLHMRRKSSDEVNTYLEEKELKLVSKYVNSKTTLKVLHSVCGNTFEKTFNHLLHNPKCPFCNPPKTAKKGLETTKKLIAEKEGHILLSDKYENQYTPLEIKCKQTNKIEVTYLKLFVKNGCKSCNKKRIADNLDIFKINKLEEIKKEMMKKGYTLLSHSYQSNKQKLHYLCP